MQVNFAVVLRDMSQDTMLELMAAARNDPDYYLTTLLPERVLPDYNVEAGNITVRATMAGLVGMDSPYPEGGAIDVSTFLEKSAKIAIALGLKEETLRQLQKFVREYMLANNGAGAPNPEDFLTQEAFNFWEKVIVQAVKDTREWMRGQALKGQIDWTFNKKRLQVDYGFPAANILAERTGTSAYGGTASKFWEDTRTQNRALRRSSRIVRIANPDTVDEIVYNSANSMNVLEENGDMVRVQKITGDQRVSTGDARDTITIIKYAGEGEVLDPSQPGATLVLPFIDKGEYIAVGSGVVRGYRVGEGSTTEPRNELELGYTHLAPTVEGNGQMGDWGRMYTPQERPWELRGEGVCNFLPVIEGFNRVVRARTAMSA